MDEMLTIFAFSLVFPLCRIPFISHHSFRRSGKKMCADELEFGDEI